MRVDDVPGIAPHVATDLVVEADARDRGDRALGSEVERVDVATGTLQQRDQIVVALHVLHPEAPAFVGDDPVRPVSPEGGRDRARLRAGASRPALVDPCEQPDEPELLGGTPRLREEVVRTAALLPEEEDAREVALGVRDERPAPQASIRGERVREVSGGVVQPSAGGREEAEVACAGAEGPGGEADTGVSLGVREKRVVHDRGALAVAERVRDERERGQRRQAIRVPREGAEPARGESVEEGARLLDAPDLRQDQGQTGAPPGAPDTPAPSRQRSLPGARGPRLEGGP